MTTSTALQTATADRASSSPRTRRLLEGPIVPTLLRLGAPNALVNVLLIAVTATVDAHFVGQLGSSQLAGLALVFPVIMLMQQVANGSMGGAIASSVARAVGAGRRDDAAALAVHGLVIGLGMAALFTTLALAAGPVFYGLMGGTGPMLAAAVEYSNTIFAGAIAYWMLGALTGIVRGAGQAAVLAGVYVGAEALHILLVPALVFGIGPVPALGVAGAGVATVISFTVSTVVLAWYVASGRTGLRLSLRSVRLSRQLFAEILRVGGPSSLTPILNNLTLAVLTGFVATLGPTAVAGFGAAARLEYLQIPLTAGLGFSVLAMVGTNIGAGRWPRALRISWIAAALAMAATGGIGLMAIGWPEVWMALFTADDAVHTAGARYLRLVALTYPFLGLGFVLASAFQAAGRPLWPLLAITGRVLAVGAGGWVAIHVTQSGLAGLAAVVAVGLIVYGSTLAIAFHTGAWRSGPRPKTRSLGTMRPSWRAPRPAHGTAAPQHAGMAGAD
jgi:putative MATE family efflux protein